MENSNDQNPITPVNYSDDRSVLVRIKVSPNGLRRMARILEQLGDGKSVCVNWFTSQIEFVRCDDDSISII